MRNDASDGGDGGDERCHDTNTTTTTTTTRVTHGDDDNAAAATATDTVSDEQAAVVVVVADVTIKFGKDTVQLSLPLHATMAELRAAIAARTRVPADKQRLLFNAPVCKERRRGEAAVNAACTLADLLPASLVTRLRTHHTVTTTATATSATPQHVALSAMLLGSAVHTPHVDSKATSEVSRLVATTVEVESRWYRCCYAKGYVRQAAYVCRTCVDEGRADAAHALCLACAEICHADHEIEEWGVRYYMRCDCCTAKCWKTPPSTTTTSTTTTTNTTTTPPTLLVGVTAAADDDDDEQRRATASAQQRRPLTLSNRDIAHRTRRKRSRSSSPLASQRGSGGGGSPLVGVRVTPASSNNNNNNNSSSNNSSAFAASAPLLAASTDELADRSHDAGAVAVATAATASVLPPVTLTLPSTGARDDVSTSTAPSNHSSSVASAANTATTTTAAVAASSSSTATVSRCVFVLDSSTGKPPSNAIIPVNRKNRYPRHPLTWCYCEAATPEDDPECGGIACMLCTSCFWSAHVTRLHTAQLRRVPCYGDVEQGDTLAFRCHTCNTLVCPPCRFRCHKDHQCDDTPILVPLRDDEQQQQQQQQQQQESSSSTAATRMNDGNNNNNNDAAAAAATGALFSCGCRGLCSIAEAVPADEVDDVAMYSPVPDHVAVALMNDDVFSGFVCAHCMREHPWLMHDDPMHCYGGTLPAKVPASAQPQRRVIACGATAADACAAPHDVFPYHGMLLPVSAFTAQATCRCAPCRAAYDAFAPRADADATDMVVELHDHCDNCGVTIKEQQAFMCVTCETTLERTYFLCSDCNALRQRLVAQQHQLHPAETTATTTTTTTTSAAATTTSDAQAAERHDGEVQAPTYSHDLSHEFFEDTLDNLTTLCGMQTLQSLDEESRRYLSENLHTVLHEQFSISDTIANTFGQTPIEFDDDELREFALVNRARASSGGSVAVVDKAAADDDDDDHKRSKKTTSSSR